MSLRLRPGRSSLLSALVLSCLALSTAAHAQDAEKVTLRTKGEVGQVARYKSETNIKITFAGQELNIDESSTSETTVKAANESSVTLERKGLTNSTSINGETIPDEGTGTDQVSTLRLAPDGSVLEYKAANPDPDDPNDSLNIRLLLSTNVLFPEGPVGPGDKWTRELTGDDTLGTKNAKADFEFLAFEEVNGARAAKIQMVYAETSGSPALRATSTQWIDLDSGDSIKSTFEATGINFDMGGESVSATANGTSERTSGGLVKADGQQEVPNEPQDAIAAKVKDFEKLDGLFPLYRRDQDGRVTLYLEIAPDQLGKLAMLQTTASTGLADGRIAAGDPINDLLFAFERTPNNRVVMKVPNLFFRAKAGTAMADVVKRSFPESIVESYSIEAEQDGRVLIDVSSLFTADISMVGQMLQGGGNPLLGGGGNSFSLDRTNTYIKTLKNFPENLYVESMYNFAGRGGGGGLEAMLSGSGSTTADSRSALIQINYNLYLLPTENGYQPRLFDPRVGFFTVAFQDFTNDTEIYQTKQYINRWHLEKTDPNAAVSDVKNPVVYWIDAAVPAEYRQSVKEAIEAWNVPFEKAGYRNAVVAKQMESVDQFDHADMRYNVVRWITSPADAYAIALFRVNPVTGQILNTSVSVDSNIVKAFANEYGDFIRPEALEKSLKEKIQAHAAHGCEIGKLAQANLALGDLAIRAFGQQAGISRDDYVNQFVKWVVMHEVGHTLGLRHNFVASTELTLDQLKNPATVSQKGTASSVMDYVAFNPSALDNPGVRFYGDKPGVYDEWAIAYGYKTIANAPDTEGELFELKKHASMTNQPGLTWLGDEYADSFDPYVTRFDLAGDPINYWLRMGDLSNGLLMKLDQFSPKPGQSYTWFRRDFNALFNEYSKSTSQLSRFIGGVRRNPNFKGDANERMPMIPISGEEQRKALDQIVKQAFDSKALAFPKRYYQMFQPNQNGTLVEHLIGAMDDYPMFDTLSSYQAGALNSLLGSGTLRTLLNQEFEANDPTQTLTAREVFAKVTASVWSELDTNQPVDILRRQLQREHLDRLVTMVLDKDGTPAEAKALAYMHLTVLQAKLKAGASKVAHESTRIHWQESLMRLDRALGATPTIGSTGGGSSSSLLEQLLGG